ncbi:MAG: hypothetical protein ISN28_06695 [Ectothiorhodospiraceae bacterium AqS1]|nr:hypothetical protein [Ectothiorhodospiraceae bacterium AqS1]
MSHTASYAIAFKPISIDDSQAAATANELSRDIEDTEMRWIAEEKDEMIAKIYGKPTAAQLARAASRIESACRAFVECADTAIRSGEMNIPNALRFEAACRALDHAAAEIRVWLAESGYGNRIDPEQNTQIMEGMIHEADKTIADLRDAPTFPLLAGTASRLARPCKAFANCAESAQRREQIFYAYQFDETYRVLHSAGEKLRDWVQKCR